MRNVLVLATAMVTLAMGAPFETAARGPAPQGGVSGSEAAISYQGRLKQAGTDFTGTADVRFSVWRDPVSIDPGDRVGELITIEGVAVEQGVFTCAPGFALGTFGGAERYLQVEVRTAADLGVFRALSPRMRILGVPTAQFASRASTLGPSDQDLPRAARVDEDGTITVESAIRFEGAISVSETVRLRSISALAWVLGDGPVRRAPDGQFLEVETPGNAATGNCFLPLQLPAGAVLRSVKLSYIDASNLGNLELTLRRAQTGPTSFGSVAIASVSSTGNSAAVRTLDLGALLEGADGQPLFLHAKWTTGVDPIKVAGVEVTYSITSILP